MAINNSTIAALLCGSAIALLLVLVAVRLGQAFSARGRGTRENMTTWDVWSSHDE